MQWKALFVGDIVINQLPSGNLLSPEFAKLMQEHAVCSCNFEAPVKGTGSPIKKAGPHIQQHPLAPELLENEGFNIINLANNHIYDYGEDALQITLQAFKKSIYVGAGLNFDAAYSLKIKTINGLKIGFLSYCEAEFGALTLHSNNKSGFAWINHPSVNSTIIEAKKNIDVLIVQVHAGVEQIDIPLPEWRERYKELIRFGADAVIGTHPHVPQGWEVYNGKPVFYSLGNFYFDAENTHPSWNKGMAVSLTFKEKDLIAFDIIPIRKTSGGVVVDTGQTAVLNKLNGLLENPGYINSVNKIALSLWEQYYRNYYDIALKGIHNKVSFKKVLAAFVRRLFFKKTTSLNTPLLLHNIRIESHRWVVERALEANNTI